jgi:hypothetical protein
MINSEKWASSLFHRQIKEEGSMKKILTLLLVALLLSCAKRYEQQALFDAIGTNNIEGVRKCLEEGMKINQKVYNPKYKNSIAPLHIAAMYSNKEMVEFLLNNKAEANITDDSGSASLHFAIYENHYDIVELLIQRGAMRNLPEIADLLIKSGANINAATKGGVTPLDIAKKRNYPDLIKLLGGL